jgi:hypothetical protein
LTSIFTLPVAFRRSRGADETNNLAAALQCLYHKSSLLILSPPLPLIISPRPQSLKRALRLVNERRLKGVKPAADLAAVTPAPTAPRWSGTLRSNPPSKRICLSDDFVGAVPPPSPPSLDPPQPSSRTPPDRPKVRPRTVAPRDPAGGHDPRDPARRTTLSPPL